MSWKYQRGRQNMRSLLTLGNEQGVMEREVGRGWGDWVMGNEGDT